MARREELEEMSSACLVLAGCRWGPRTAPPRPWSRWGRGACQAGRYADQEQSSRRAVRGPCWHSRRRYPAARDQSSRHLCGESSDGWSG